MPTYEIHCNSNSHVYTARMIDAPDLEAAKAACEERWGDTYLEDWMTVSDERGNLLADKRVGGKKWTHYR